MSNLNLNKICIIGAGYVGFSLAVLLKQYFQVSLVENQKTKVDLINKGKSPIFDKDMDGLLCKGGKVRSTNRLRDGVINSDYIIIALPTSLKQNFSGLDTSIIENCIYKISLINSFAQIIIKSTIPVGFTAKMQKKYPNMVFSFVPEFLREGHALQDNQYPSRLIIGSDNKDQNIKKIFLKIANKKPQVFFMQSQEAEAVKLFSNSYLANRVSFFNELDSFCLSKGLNAKNVIEGVSADKRIGNYYNNPSFGYGGYCLPKDTKHLLTNFNSIPTRLFSAVISSNNIRKSFIAQQIIKMNPSCLGVYRLNMKSQSDNNRDSAILDILDILDKAKMNILIFEPNIVRYRKFKFIESLQKFKQQCDLVIANRMDDELLDISNKVFTRDLFHEN